MTSDSRKHWTELCFIASLAPFILSLAIPGIQCYRYLRIGAWEPLSLLLGLKRVGIDWASETGDWVGLHHLLDQAPLSASLFLVGLFLIYLGMWLDRVMPIKTKA